MMDQGRFGRLVDKGFSAPPMGVPGSWTSNIDPGDRARRMRPAFKFQQALDVAQLHEVHRALDVMPTTLLISMEHGAEARIELVPSAVEDGRTPHRLSGMRVLVVEDEPLVALDLQFALEDEGALVIGPALSLHDALELVAREPQIDGAILDVDLAGIEVYPAADLLRARGTPFVFHTGHGSRASLTERFPGSLTCSKPTTPSTLITALLRA